LPGGSGSRPPRVGRPGRTPRPRRCTPPGWGPPPGPASRPQGAARAPAAPAGSALPEDPGGAPCARIIEEIQPWRQKLPENCIPSITLSKHVNICPMCALETAPSDGGGFGSAPDPPRTLTPPPPGHVHGMARRGPGPARRPARWGRRPGGWGCQRTPSGAHRRSARRHRGPDATELQGGGIDSIGAARGEDLWSRLWAGA